MTPKRFTDCWSLPVSAAKRVSHDATKHVLCRKDAACLRNAPLKPLGGISAAVFLTLLLGGTAAHAENPTRLWIGAATTSITPSESVVVTGSLATVVADSVQTPVTATVVVLESRRDDQSLDTAIMVSCDVADMPTELLDKTREAVRERLPAVDVNKIIMCGTHSHSAPCVRTGYYHVAEGVMAVEDYQAFFVERVTDAIVAAWEGRKPGGVSWGLGHAAVAFNRRSAYADGKTTMYGPTAVDAFAGMEGPEDHGVQTLFFWDADQHLVAMAVNVACPAQAMGTGSKLSADYWHEVRTDLRGKYGQDLCVLGWIGAAGDQSPHTQWRKKAEERMRAARGLTQCGEIARRIVNAVGEAYEVAKSDIHDADVPLIHLVQDVKLPRRLVTDAEYATAKANAEKYAADPVQLRRYRYYHDVVARYQSQDENPSYGMELHVLRIGDVAIATNPFELFTQYGIQMQARGKAEQTFVIQLCNGRGIYLPTPEAAPRGGYSALVYDNLVSPAGGRMLVDLSVEQINKLMAGGDSEAGKTPVKNE